jgi:hypothetical protein
LRGDNNAEARDGKLWRGRTPVRGREGAYRVGGCAEYKQYNARVCVQKTI